MRINWKLLAGFTLLGGVISLISGIAGGNPFGVIVLRLLLSAILFGALGLGVQALLGRYLPELLQTAPPAKPGAGESVDIIIDEELPVSRETDGEKWELEGEASGPPEAEAAEEILPGPEDEEPGEAMERGPELELQPSGGGDRGDDQDRGEVGTRRGGMAAAAPLPGEAEPGEIDDLEVLPEFDAVGEDGVSGELESPEEAEEGETDRPVRKTPSTPREMRQAQIEETVRDQDPENLARAVRTFMKKDR